MSDRKRSYRCFYIDTFGSLEKKIITFFFQAEDGIRGHCVTGVQTCALPIGSPPVRLVPAGGELHRPGGARSGRDGDQADALPHEIGRASCRERV